VDPRTGLDDVEKRKFLTLLGLALRPLGRPAHSQSLYRLRYPGSNLVLKHPKKDFMCQVCPASMMWTGFVNWRIEEDEMGGICSTHVGMRN
jgi:hypothetical protein